MSRGRAVGFIGSGQAGKACVERLSGLHERLGPVWSPSIRLASRFVNSIGAGFPVNVFDEFAVCSPVLVCLPTQDVSETVKTLASSGLDWTNKAVLLCDSQLDSCELRPLAARGAVTGSISPIDVFDGRRFVVEGDREAIRAARELVRDHRTAFLEVERGRKAMYLAGLSIVSNSLAPAFDACVDCLTGAGLSSGQAEAITERAFLRTMRAHLHGGSKAWSGPVAREDAPAVHREFDALRKAGSRLARFYYQTAALALDRFGRDAKWLVQSAGRKPE